MSAGNTLPDLIIKQVLRQWSLARIKAAMHRMAACTILLQVQQGAEYQCFCSAPQQLCAARNDWQEMVWYQHNQLQHA
jgi:hypothetical protein